jgi:hypothetical protein
MIQTITRIILIKQEYKVDREKENTTILVEFNNLRPQESHH